MRTKDSGKKIREGKGSEGDSSREKPNRSPCQKTDIVVVGSATMIEKVGCNGMKFRKCVAFYRLETHVLNFLEKVKWDEDFSNRATLHTLH